MAGAKSNKKEKVDYELKEYTTEELLKMKYDEATEGLNIKQIKFCEFYVQNYNVAISLMKAGYSEGTNTTPWARKATLMKRPGVKRYMQWLKVRAMNKALISGTDIITQWGKIAFADMTDFVNIGRYGVTLKPATQMDGQLIKSIKSGRDGISIELHDKLKALNELARYTRDMPKDYKQILEERKVEIMEKEYELKRKLVDLDSQQREDDGFIEALKQSAATVWEGTEEPTEAIAEDEK